MSLARRLTTAIASGALLFSSFAGPAFAAEITISGNGQNSTSEASVDLSHSTNVVQNNSANITNDVDANAGTGGNEANGNNGGSVTVTTGDASTNVTVNNHANSNVAEVNCCPTSGNVTVNISGNAQNTTNDVDLNMNSTQDVHQNNTANIRNDVDASAKTGGNEANGNNGGSVTISTGNASTNVTVNNSANLNSARIGGNGGNGGSLSLHILNNAQNSENEIEADLDSNAVVVQDNYAYIKNDVDADAKTGGNEANGNNGGLGDGDVTISTGDATNDVSVDNQANFNSADLDCGCLFGQDWSAKIAGNAQGSENEIELDLDSSQQAFQDNWAKVRNELDDLHAKTGGNEASGNNEGSEGGDPTIHTGDANSNTTVNTSVNVNQLGGGLELPEFPELGHITLTFDWSFIRALLGL